MHFSFDPQIVNFGIFLYIIQLHSNLIHDEVNILVCSILLFILCPYIICHLVCALSSIHIPTSSKLTLSSSGWKHAMNEQMGDLKKNQTDIVIWSHSSCKQTVGYRWVYSLKFLQVILLSILRHLVANRPRHMMFSTLRPFRLWHVSILYSSY